MPAKYVHLSGRDIDNAYDAMHDLYEPDENEQKPNVIKCDRCEELNESSDRFCGRCGFALDQEAADELETAEEAVTSEATPEDVELALKLVDKIGGNREETEAFVEEG